MKLHVHQSSGAARLLAKLTHITSGLSACATNVRLHALPTALDTLLPLDGSLCNLFHSLAWQRRGWNTVSKLESIQCIFASMNADSVTDIDPDRTLPPSRSKPEEVS